MATSQPTVTLHFPLAHMPAIITRLTTYLLEHRQSFLQTRHDATRTDFDIFGPQDQPLIRLTLQAADRPGPDLETLACLMPRPLTTEAMRLLRHLVQADLSP
ncbi:hypothetical protein NKDENANG_04141 [Candidatus Entotheonellaceae bacterium PAL068K]